jgi:anti-sigma B factor antagonist
VALAPTSCSLVALSGAATNGPTTNGGGPVGASGPRLNPIWIGARRRGTAAGFARSTTHNVAAAVGPHRAEDTDTLLALSTVTDVPGEVLVVAVGEIDLGTSPGLLSYLSRALDQPGCRTLIVDLRTVSFMGARGVGVLTTTRTLAMARNIRLAVVADHRPVLSPLRLTTDSHDVEIFPTLPSARTPPAPPVATRW